MAKVILSYKGVELRDYELPRGQITVGRRSDCDIQLDDATVSGRHALIRSEPNAYLDGYLDVFLEDCGSTNGTQVNGDPVERCQLKHGDIIRVGQHEFLYDEGEGFEPDRTVLFLPGDDLP